jgi:hypothetical protein
MSITHADAKLPSLKDKIKAQAVVEVVEEVVKKPKKGKKNK